MTDESKPGIRVTWPRALSWSAVVVVSGAIWTTALTYSRLIAAQEETRELKTRVGLVEVALSDIKISLAKIETSSGNLERGMAELRSDMRRSRTSANPTVP